MFARKNHIGIEIVSDKTPFADQTPFHPIPPHLIEWVDEFWQVDGKGDFTPPNETHFIQKITVKKIQEANASASELIKQITQGYPEFEIQSWPQQLKEAEALAADPQCETTLLSSLALIRDIEREELALRVRAKSQDYAQATGRIIGARQKIEDALATCATAEQALVVPTLIDYLQGHP